MNRSRNPEDRRSMLVSLTDEGRRQPLAAQPALRDVRRIEEGGKLPRQMPPS
nr:hypothetical protein [Halomonas alimentaria]